MEVFAVGEIVDALEEAAAPAAAAAIAAAAAATRPWGERDATPWLLTAASIASCSCW